MDRFESTIARLRLIDVELKFVAEYGLQANGPGIVQHASEHGPCRRHHAARLVVEIGKHMCRIWRPGKCGKGRWVQDKDTIPVSDVSTVFVLVERVSLPEVAGQKRNRERVPLGQSALESFDGNHFSAWHAVHVGHDKTYLADALITDSLKHSGP